MTKTKELYGEVHRMLVFDACEVKVTYMADMGKFKGCCDCWDLYGGTATALAVYGDTVSSVMDALDEMLREDMRRREARHG